MPPGVAVVDAFKNLIRHGKNHVHARQDDTSSSSAPPDPPANQRAHPERRQQANAQHKQQPQQQPQPVKAQPVATKQSQQYTREVEKIVQEERAAKDKMPTYKGLERFRLVQKMGDGAFSNVFKALDLTSGTSVAVKAVRKYELTSSQVSYPFQSQSSSYARLQAGDRHLNAHFKKKPRVTEVLLLALSSMLLCSK
jgi:hypothetical protein